MTMPTFDCPVCRNTLTVETVFAHQDVRDAIQALIDVHPEGGRLLRPMLGYVGLFAPAKTAMRFGRIAAVLREITEHIRSASVSLDGRTYAAPMDYWRQAMEEMLARRDTGALRLPLSSHIYLFRIVVGYSEKAESKAEARQEQQRAGHAGVGANPNRQPHRAYEGPVLLDACLPETTQPAPIERAPMPPEIREQLRQTLGKTIINQGEKRHGDE